MKTIGVVGTRRRDTEEDYQIVKDKFFSLYEQGDRICSGLCYQGADRFAVLIALNVPWIPNNLHMNRIMDFAKKTSADDKRYDITPLWFPADWPKYGKAAGPIRNTDIARESTVLIACVAKDRTGGTEDTIKKFIKLHGDKDLHIV